MATGTPSTAITGTSTTKQRVLFLCTHNSARSQIAEGLLRARAGDRYDAYSAGVTATRVRPEAIAVMNELGVDLSGQSSKAVDGFAGQSFDWVITVCDDAREACPNVPGGRRTLHWSFEDPAAAEGSEAERSAVFRRVRDQIADRLGSWLTESAPASV